MRDPLVLVLLAAIVLTVLTGDVADTIVIALVIVVNTTLAVRQEISADRAVSALARLVAPVVRVLRDDREVSAPVADLVPGDLIVLAEGDLVPADSLLVGGASLQVDESALTGESMPVDKSLVADPRSGTVGRSAGSSASGGEAGRPDRGLTVCSTPGPSSSTAAAWPASLPPGSRSKLGEIASMLHPQERATPLQQRMTQLSRYLATGAVGLCALVMGLGLVSGQSFELMLLTAVSLAVAAVPESLPVVVTVSLALAARRMAERHAIVRNLAAVETLGSVTMLATDKTGTLTQARMAVTGTWWPPDGDEESLLRALVLCNDATLDTTSGTSLGDPTETALLHAAVGRGVVVDQLRASFPRVSELPFDSSRKRMLTVHRCADGGVLAICKGAPESLLHAGLLLDEPAVIDTALQLSRSMAATGARVIAVARRRATAEEATLSESGLSLLGLVQLQDPLRPTSVQTIAACHEAGIDVALVTGDHPATAASVAALVGITADPQHVVARATPADKLVLIQAWQEAGHVVAMTGDGVNDGPALRRADIGVAMGERGTEVARQSADLIIGNDDLGTVIAAVEEGRRVYANIRRFLLYALSGGASEILLMLLGPLFGTPLPLLPAQILWVNLLTHSFAGAALGTEPVETGTMCAHPGTHRGRPGRWGSGGVCDNRRRACRRQPQREPGGGQSARVLRCPADPRSRTAGGGLGGPRPHAETRGWPLARTDAARDGRGDPAARRVGDDRATAFDAQHPAASPAIWGLALLSALTGYACARVLRPRTF